MKPQSILASLAMFLSMGVGHADLLATFKSGTDTDTRVDRLPALLVEAGQLPTPFLETGPFEVTWTGKLVLTERQRLYFSFAGKGSATLSIGGEEVLTEQGELGAAKSERIRLNGGEHDISITYLSAEDGSAHFRLYWEERSFPHQSVPPGAFLLSSPPDDKKREGRELFAHAHCAKCHTSSQGFGTSPMPEIIELAPLLPNTGGRLNERWVTEWILDPASKRPGTMMPALLDSSKDENKQKAADLAAWLATMKLTEAPPAPDAGMAQQGGEHFHRLGCAACHTAPTGESDPQRIPLREVAAKYQPGALVDFLKNPSQWAPHTGMPNFAFTDDEANSIAAWLLQESGKIKVDAISLPQGDATRGVAVAKELNCGSCHAGLPVDLTSTPSLEDIFEKSWDTGGCTNAHAGLPDYSFDDGQRAALESFRKKGAKSLSKHIPAEYAQRAVTTLRCTSCHSMDSVNSLLDTTHIETKDLVAHVQGETEKIDQSRPDLTLTGEMLHEGYISKMIDGKAKPRPRPWLDMRMPAFQSRASYLATGLAHMHGVVLDGPETRDLDAEKIEIGKQLVGAEGFACNTCHAIGGTKATAAFEVEGINFSLVHERIRKEWYDRWMDNPESVRPGTKMPKYSERGKSQRTDILDGDAKAQFDAIWEYLLSLEQ